MLLIAICTYCGSNTRDARVRLIDHSAHIVSSQSTLDDLLRHAAGTADRLSSNDIAVTTIGGRQFYHLSSDVLHGITFYSAYESRQANGSADLTFKFSGLLENARPSTGVYLLHAAESGLYLSFNLIKDKNHPGVVQAYFSIVSSERDQTGLPKTEILRDRAFVVETRADLLDAGITVNGPNIIVRMTGGRELTFPLPRQFAGNDSRFMCGLFAQHADAFICVNGIRQNGREIPLSGGEQAENLLGAQARTIAETSDNFAPERRDLLFIKAAIGNDYRDCIAGISPYTFTFPARDVQANGVLTFGLAVLDESAGTACVQEFAVDAVKDGRRQRLFTERIETSGKTADNRWFAFRQSLSAVQRDFDSFEFSVRPVSGGSAFAAWADPTIYPVQSGKERPNVLLISLDTVRKDRLSCFGYTRKTSPNIDRFAAQGALFDQCISQASWTTPSHLSILTSQYPSVHGLFKPLTVDVRPMSDEKQTVAEILQDNGYATAAFVGHYPTMSGTLGLYQGFSRYSEYGDILSENPHDIELVTGEAYGWIRDNHENGPFFVFLHSFETHTPFTGTAFLPDGVGVEEAAGKDTYLPDLYDGDVVFTDRHLGVFFEKLDALGTLDNTLVIITSDHGYIFPGEHGNYSAYGNSLYESVIRVPLIVVYPGAVPAGESYSLQTQSIDIAPTILDAAGADQPADFQGRSLMPLFEGKKLADIPAYSEALNVGPERKSIRFNGLKYIYIPEIMPEDRANWAEKSISLVQKELFNLAIDPAELKNIAPGKEALTRDMQEIVDGFIKSGILSRSGIKQKSFVRFDEKALLKLKSLGYIQ